ncbi:MAG: phosphoglycolate phosphatase [Gammaproteobacteria bacterium]|nr:phosphoglycolate phosphatase [Gammaproteobacteria bacterium]
MVLIDLDGTLVDSVPDLADCVDRALAALGLPRRGEARVRDWVGNGIDRLIKRALTGTLDGEPDPDRFERTRALFDECYARHFADRSRPFPGAREGVDALKAAGYPLGCVTNKAARFTRPLLEALGFAGDFGLVVAGDTLPAQKPDPAPLRYAAGHFGVRPEESLLIGDSVNDVRAARAAGFAVICVSYGYNHGEDIRSAHPDAVIDSLRAVRTLLDEAA